ncbi:MAG TPA: hypothetical protein VJR71_18190 [Pseudolabrys sp.]|nr:hypothetical protein [Pseudolabrys sp.]
MTARQYLLSESDYCRMRAAGCADPFIAKELRQLAEKFERTAITTEDSASDRKIATMTEDAPIQGFPGIQRTGYNKGR